MNSIEATHDPRARSRAAARVPVLPEELALAGGGWNTHTETRWERVRGPHMRVVRKKFARNRTGCPGISFSTGKGGPYFIVNLGRSNRKFNVRTLGRHEAWRRAVKLRAEHELKIQSVNARIAAARQRNNP